MTRLPTLFVSHGAPTFALAPGRTGPALAHLARSMTRPVAILVVSPHWSTPAPRVTTRAHQQAWHDFGGFPAPLYALQYSPPGAPAVAERVIALLADRGIAAQTDARQPLDHGAWVPLLHLYPEADVPVIQVSLQPQQPPAAQLALGRALAPLRDEGVLIIGSGAITHNLGQLDWAHADAPAFAWAEEFRGWIAGRLLAGDVDALTAWRRLAPHAVRAHPTDEHLLPLFVAIGAAADDAAHASRLSDEIVHASLAMDAYVFGRTAD